MASYDNKPAPGALLDRSDPLAGGLALLLPLNEGAGARYVDSVAEKAFAPTGGVSWTPGRAGPCLLFDGSTGSVALGTLGGDPVTVACWFRTTDASAAFHTLFGKGAVWHCGVYNGFVYHRDVNTGNFLVVNTGPAVADGAWHHLAVTIAGTGTGGVSVYADGSLVGTGTSSTAGGTAALLLGDSTVGGFFPGAIDAPAVWSRVLSPGAIASARSDPWGPLRSQCGSRFSAPAAGGGAVTGAADLASVATLTAGASVREQGSASLAAGATLAGGAAVQEQASASFASVATLGAAGTVQERGSAGLAAGATLAGAATVQEFAAAAPASVATLAGDAQVGNTLSAAAALASVATLTGSATVQERAGAVLAAGATLAGGAAVQEQASASFASVATLAGAALVAGSGPVATYLEEAIVARVAASGALVALVGARVFPGNIPETQPLPALSYLTLSDDHAHALSGAAGIARAAVRIDVRGRTLAEAAAIRRALRATFDGWKGTVGSVRVLWCRLDDRSTAYEPDDAGSDRGTRAAPSTFVFTYRVSIPTF